MYVRGFLDKFVAPEHTGECRPAGIVSLMLSWMDGWMDEGEIIRFHVACVMFCCSRLVYQVKNSQPDTNFSIHS